MTLGRGYQKASQLSNSKEENKQKIRAGREREREYEGEGLFAHEIEPAYPQFAFSWGKSSIPGRMELSRKGSPTNDHGRPSASNYSFAKITAK